MKIKDILYLSLIAIPVLLFSGCSSSSDDDKSESGSGSSSGSGSGSGSGGETGGETGGESGGSYELLPSSLTITFEAQEVTFTVQSDVDYELTLSESCSDWLSILDDGSRADDDSFESYDVTLYATENTGSSDRTGSVDVLFATSPEMTLTFTLVQEYEGEEEDSGGSGSGSSSSKITNTPTINSMGSEKWGEWTN